MDIDITEKQQEFIESTAFETLFGGCYGVMDKMIAQPEVSAE